MYESIYWFLPTVIEDRMSARKGFKILVLM